MFGRMPRLCYRIPQLRLRSVQRASPLLAVRDVPSPPAAGKGKSMLFAQVVAEVVATLVIIAVGSLLRRWLPRPSRVAPA